MCVYSDTADTADSCRDVFFKGYVSNIVGLLEETVTSSGGILHCNTISLPLPLLSLAARA